MTVLEFPAVPPKLLQAESVMEPCPDVWHWAHGMFLDQGSKFYNPDHAHLDRASIGFVWTNVENAKSGKRIIGACQLGEPAGGTPWAKARQYEQLTRWFDHIPDFVITLDAVWLSTARPEQVCALVEHEMYHAFYKTDEFGDPKFDQDGNYTWSVLSHDVEEFVGVVKRYGAYSTDLEEMKEVFEAGPQITRAQLDGLCGVCHGQR